MYAYYFYCPACGYEAEDVDIVQANPYSDGDFYICPLCGEESDQAEIAK